MWYSTAFIQVASEEKVIVSRALLLVLQGTNSNRAAIGAKIKVTFKEDNKERFVYREVNSGGSFGSNPLRQHIGIGKANIIDKIEV